MQHGLLRLLEERVAGGRWKSYWRHSPEMGTRSRTLSALRMRYSDSATTCWHQKMSLVSQEHVTLVILHLRANKERV